MKTLVLAALALTLAAPLQRDASGFPKPDRPVAEIVSPIWDTEEGRDGARETEQVFAAMGIKAGDAVADIGAGSGYYSVRLSRRVGPAGKVFAEDIMPDYLAGLEARLKSLGLANVTVVRGTADDARIPAASVDAALLIHMYHEIDQPFGLLHRLAGSFKPNGRLGIVDSERETWQHGTPPALLRCELAAVGYRQVSIRTLEGGVGYLAIFAPPAPNRLPKPADIKPCKA